MSEKIFIYSADPCWKRLLDAEKIQDYLVKNSYKVVKKPSDADIIIIITCGFLNFITEFALNKIKEFQEYNAELIVAGCIPDIDKEKLAKIFNGKTMTTKDLEEKIEELFYPQNNIRYKDLDDANILFKNYEEVQLNELTKKLGWIENIYLKIEKFIYKHLLEKYSIGYQFSRKQFHIRISWGCNRNCSYCAINKAVGPHRSKPLKKCIMEFKKGLKKGFKNFVLDATDVGLYGLDIGSNFPELLDEMTKIHGEYKISIRELHPAWIVKYVNELKEVIKRNKILILDVALQSANTRILKLMNRYSNVKKMKEAILILKNSSSDMFLTIECIIGFPTETWDEFLDTINFIKEVNSSGGQIYLFSCKTGTEAEKIEPKVNKKEMAKRSGYAKKFLKNAGYIVSYSSKEGVLDFIKK